MVSCPKGRKGMTWPEPEATPNATLVADPPVVRKVQKAAIVGTPNRDFGGLRESYMNVCGEYFKCGFVHDNTVLHAYLSLSSRVWIMI